jgi:phosphatidylglycerophosphate synthase
MTFYGNRQRFEGLSSRIGRAFSRLGLGPNAWTFLSIIPALASVWFLVNQQYLAAAALFILAAFLDMVDGAVARATGRTSKAGAYLDTMVDRYVEFLIVLGLVWLAYLGVIPSVYLPAVVWIFVYYFGAIMTSAATAAAKEKDFIKNEIRGGLVERAERMILLFVGIVAAHFDTLYLAYMIVLLALLANITVLQRAWTARKSSHQPGK